ncbi:MAG: SCO family protein [Bdellovibrionales bacterium]|nr:SCO family protein [Bdellovibrionales bacterium]NQZ20088.1 SCO family protein [Bdellovibrionales bacterium]
MLKLLLSVLTSLSAWAYLPENPRGEQNEKPEAIENVGIDENLNASIPGDLVFSSDNGNQVRFADFYSNGRPLIVSLVYYSCPSLCNLHLKGVFEVLGEMKLKPGKDYDLLAVSFDPKEDADLGRAKKETYINEYLKMDPETTEGIHFLTGTEENIKKLADTVGFKYKWVEENNEWAHASAAIITTPKGLISRYLHGVYFEAPTFRLSVVEASKGLIGSISDSFALFCFRYDPKTNKYSLYIYNVLRAVASIVLILLAIFLIPFWMKARKQNS